MNYGQRDSLDQALFGYADGHRQIASSVRLPPKDLFLLSAATDLASGAQLGEGDSYLSGLPLRESRRYALFRTWAAPEMSRPGCVWSHVLLLDSKAAASIPALAEVVTLFLRPAGGVTSTYGEPVEVVASRTVEPADAELVATIIAGYYGDGRATIPQGGREASVIENAILAVWSQQWPRLRSMFSFCTAALEDGRRSGSGEYSVQVLALDEQLPVVREPWVAAAANDAALNAVTPMRRFLWRYGRDISAPRRQYRMLVDLFLNSKDAKAIMADKALNIFRGLPDSSDGAVLKRDILGLGPESPRLVAPVSVLDLLKLLPSGLLPEVPTPLEVRGRLEVIAVGEVGAVARHYAANASALSPWRDEIHATLVARADKQTVMTDYPAELVNDVLLEREDLIDIETLSILGNDVLPRLIKSRLLTPTDKAVLDEMLRRDAGDAANAVASAYPDRVFQSAVQAKCEDRLHDSWLSRLRDQREKILASDWLSGLKSTKQLAFALAILRYPRQLGKRSGDIAQRLSELTDDAFGDDRTNMQAALLRIAIDEGSLGSWDLILLVLPDLRPSIMKASLPKIAETMLNGDLPHFYSAGYWDLNKRILLSLAEINAVFPNIDFLRKIGLTSVEIDIVLDRKERTGRRNRSKFWPWLPY